MADRPMFSIRNAADAAKLGRLMPPLAERAGDHLAIRKEGKLPDVCVKCGVAGEVTRKRQLFQWYPPWVYVLAISPLIFIIVALAVQKRGSLELPLCRACRRRWRNARIAVALSVVWLLFGMIACIPAFAGGHTLLGALLLLSAIAAPIAAGVKLARPATLQAARVDDVRITLRGVHPDAIAAIEAASAQARLAEADQTAATLVNQPSPL